MTASRHNQVFIHGFAGNGGHWAEVRAQLDPGNRGIAIDLAGHGARVDAPGPYTIERCARDVIEAIEHPGALLVGHSMGTRIALEVAAQAPDMIAGLVLVDGSNAPADPATVADEMRSKIRQHGAATAMTQTMEGFLIEGITPARRAEILNHALSLPPETAIAYWASMAEWDTTHFNHCVDQASCPVTVLQSTSIVQTEKLERHLIKDAPNSLWLDTWHHSGKAKITRIPNCGHYTMIERPTVVARACLTI